MTTIVTGVIGADCHVVGNKILEYTLSEAAFYVVNIGVLCPQEEFIHAAIETSAKAILISSLYGHAELDCRGFRGMCLEKGIGDILLYIGGNLAVGHQKWERTENLFLEMGFNRVYSADTDLQRMIQELRQDLGLPQNENG